MRLICRTCILSAQRKRILLNIYSCFVWTISKHMAIFSCKNVKVSFYLSRWSLKDNQKISRKTELLEQIFRKSCRKKIFWRDFSECCQKRYLHVQKKFLMEDNFFLRITCFSVVFCFSPRLIWRLGAVVLSRVNKITFYMSRKFFSSNFFKRNFFYKHYWIITFFIVTFGT